MTPRLLLPMLAIGLLACLPAAGQVTPGDAAPAGHYEIDPAHTCLYFRVEHMGISKVYGRFDELEGAFTLGDRPAFEVTINTASINTNVEKRDNHLRSPEFFDAERFPHIRFETRRVEIDGDEYALTGDFTMHGQTHELTVPLTCMGAVEAQGKTRVGFVGTLTIDRRRWGMDTYQGLVGNDIKLLLSFEGVRQ